jgi:hypothetical protein
MRYFIVIVCVLWIAYFVNDYLISKQFSHIFSQNQITGTVERNSTWALVSWQTDLPPIVNELIDQLDIKNSYHPSQQTYYLIWNYLLFILNHY